MCVAWIHFAGKIPTGPLQSFSSDPYTPPIEKRLITMALLHLSIPQNQQYNNVVINYSSNIPWQS